jgi:uncharacterized protein YegP (UPF0339 family)/6-pyruvoyl-tetrahydropterin synthase
MGLFSWLFGKKKNKKTLTEQKMDETVNNKIEEENEKNQPTNSAIGEKSKETESIEVPTVSKTTETKSTCKTPKNEIKHEAENPAAGTVKNKKYKAELEEKTAEKEPIEETQKPEKIEKASFTGKFEINRSRDGKKYFFNLYASNQVIIATSQMYSSAQSALTGVKSVIANAAKAPIEDQTLKTYEILPYPKWEIYLDNGNKYRFRLNAANGSCICHSQGYTSKSNCKNGIDSIIRSSKNPQIDKAYLKKGDN